MIPNEQKLHFRLPVWSFLFGILLLLTGCNLFQKNNIIHAPFFKTDASVVEAALDAMSTEQKLGQMIIAEITGEEYLGRLYEDVGKGLLGGAIIKGLTLARFSQYADSLRTVSSSPLFIGTLETGLLNNQFSDAVPFPDETSWSAIAGSDTEQAIRQLYRRQLALAGINWSMGPRLYAGAVWNPVTQMPNENYLLPLKPLRQWSQEGMIRMGYSFAHLVRIPKDTAGLTAQILAPYRKLAKAGIAGFWITPEVLDPEAPRNYLRNYFNDEVGFDGLLAGAGDVEQLALAGADLIVWSGDPEEARSILRELVKQRKLSISDINQRVRRILSAKFWNAKKAGSARSEVLSDSALAASRYQLFQSGDLEFHARQLWENSPVLLQDGAKVLPLRPDRFRMLVLADTIPAVFTERALKYAAFDTVIHVPREADSLFYALDTGRICLLFWDSRYESAEADTALFETLHAHARSTPVVLVHFGDATRLALADTALTIIQVYERNEHTERGAANLLFGAQAAMARLPDAIGMRFAAGTGLPQPKTRLKFSTPPEEGISPEKLVGIDAIAGSAIAQKIIPGCQVLVAQNGNIIYSKSFGKNDYNGGPEVTDNSLYDIASITKVAATTLAVMQLKDLDKIGLENSVQNFVPAAEGKNGGITVRQLLTHTSGLQPNLPIAAYVRSPLAKRRTCSAYFCKTPQKGYSVPVAKDLYFKDDLRSSLLGSLHRLPVSSRAGVRYSDVNMVIMQQIVEKASGRTLDRYVRDEFYNPLGLRRITFLPLQKFPLQEIVPTENDTRWRQQVVHGYVHDPAAALLGGVAGHAGLFCNAEDLAVIFQMLLNEGTYGGRRYIESGTVKLFTGTDSKSKRGLGFDKLRAVKYPSFSSGMSRESFGHTGFTGTCVWVDPERNLIYIFLSNRVHPKAQNTAFYNNNIRKRIHEVVYEALDTYEPQWGIEKKGG